MPVARGDRAPPAQDLTASMRPVAPAHIHRLRHWLATAALLLLCSCLATTTAVSAPSQPSAVSITVHAPAELATIVGQRLDARLYRFDPRLADAPATLVDSITVPFTHRTGAATNAELTLGSDSEPAPRMGYYVTVFVLADGKRTHIGERNGEPGLMRVLDDGHPSDIHVVLRPVH
jgi:hypothetical protein